MITLPSAPEQYSQRDQAALRQAITQLLAEVQRLATAVQAIQKKDEGGP